MQINDVCVSKNKGGFTYLHVKSHSRPYLLTTYLLGGFNYRLVPLVKYNDAQEMNEFHLLTKEGGIGIKKWPLIKRGQQQGIIQGLAFQKTTVGSYHGGDNSGRILTMLKQ